MPTTRHSPRATLAVGVGLSVLAHVLLISWTPVDMQRVRSFPEAAPATPLRLLPNPSAVEGVAVVAADAQAVAAQSTQNEQVPASAPAPAAPAAPDTALPPLPLPWVPPGDDDYLPRSKLSAQPEPLAPIVISSPDPALMVGVVRQRLVLTLFIGASGLVERISVEDSESGPVSAAIESAAREAFFTARFTPGQLDGQPVRSRMRIEVIVE